MIWDAKPINEFCDKGRHPPALHSKHDEVARLIAWWQTRYPNTPILISKKDVSDAFKWVPVKERTLACSLQISPEESSGPPEGTSRCSTTA